MHKKFEDAIEQVSYRSFFNSASALFRRRFVSVSSGILTNRLWLKSQANHECDLLITFPSRIDENKIIWFLKQLLLLEPDIRISIKYHFTTGVYGFYITFTYSKLLKGAESLQLEKPIKSQFGGGFKSFIFDEFAFYDNVECEQSFLTSQERQSIGFFLLNEIKIQQRQEVSGIKFKPEQKLSKSTIIVIMSNHFYFFAFFSSVQRALDKQLVKQIIPLHNKDKLNNLFQNWVLPKNILKPQPIGK
ncbi:unnamed protein product [Didymodactylos carnosus]|uniref:Uncharacterized protein n=1 Tax=Didymodactylos carnosus TaxID=1234261 RepID=A0A814A3C2_9BILA|nr:unnamed protein product [Didymodactylos carnosus]CAF0975787.1 unnamed protein product [Didymodactylos carnosus]CAF3688036.1 unnamed protein product [Didymodactylos carnosus]CAF3746555.1 unnamed protein product [Didymodactylos carnosus]